MYPRRTPQLTDDLIMAQRRPGGLAVDNTQQVLAGHAGMQAKKDLAYDTVQSGLDLGKQKLAQRGRFFDDQMKFNKERFSEWKDDTMGANIIGGLGVAASGYGAYKQNQRTKEYMQKMNDYRQNLLSHYATEQDLWEAILNRLGG